MKIRAKINLLLIAVVLMTPIALSAVLFMAYQTKQQMNELAANDKLIHSATQLRQIAVESVLFHEPRARSQWQLKLASMKLDVEKMIFSDDDDRKKLKRIYRNIELAQIAYDRMFEVYIENMAIPDHRPVRDEVFFEDRTITSLLVITQELIDTGSSLIRSNRQQQKQTIIMMLVSIIIIVILMLVFTIFGWRLVRRDLLHPLRIFEQGAQQIGAGNYSHRLNIQQRDEIGELASEFDCMVEQVEKVKLEIEEHRSHLSETVTLRTKELEVAKKNAETYAKYARSLIEASLDPLVTISSQGTITDVNEAFMQATGVPREQLIGSDFSNYFTEADRARDSYKQVFDDTLVRDYPLAIRHTTGQIMDVLYNASVYKDDKGRVLGVLAAARDITAQKRLDLELREKNVELEISRTIAEKANLAKSEFLSSMSHELRTPLNAILGFAQLIESGSSPLTTSQDQSVNQILKAGWHLLALVNEILDLAAIESGNVTLSLEPVSVAEVMLECRTMIGPQAQDHGIVMTFPMFETPCFVKADRTRLKQVLINLLSNAIKYNKPGGSIIVECDKRTPDSVHISVQDSGAGLTTDELAQLFQPFNRLGKEFSGEEGAGIGLVVAKRLVEQMGGAIGAESIVATGSVFWIELSLTEAPLPAVREAKPVALTQPMVPDGMASHILLYVEDNPANLELIEQLVAGRNDLRLISATDGEQGIEFARIHQPEVILMDINLPGISGIASMRILRRDPSTAHIPVIALSANALPRDIEKGLKAGFFDYLTKPIKVDQFMDALDNALKGAEKQAASER